MFSQARWIGVMGLVATAFLVGGCNDDLKARNEGLAADNAKLQQQLNDEQARTSALQAQLASATSKMDEQAAGAMPAATGGVSKAAANRGASAAAPAPKTVTVTVSGEKLFGPGQATLKSTAKTELAKVVTDLKGKYAGQHVLVIGYTDSDPIRSSKWKTNEALSLARANAVKAELVKEGISSSRITTQGAGAANPVAPNTTAANKAKNRRVELKIGG